MNTTTDPIIAPLLKSGLALLLPVFVYGFKLLHDYLEADPKAPTIARWGWALIMGVVAFGIALANHKFETGPPASVTELWYVQGVVFWFGMLALDMVNAKVYGDSNSTRGGSAVAILPLAIGLGALLLAGDALASPARVGFARLAGGVGIGAHAYESTPSVTRADVPVSGWLAYSLGERLSLHGALSGGFVHSLGEARGALHVELDNQGDTKVSAGAFVSDYFGGGAHGMEKSSGWGVFLEPARVLSRDASGAAKAGAFVRLYSDFDNGPGALVGVKLLVFGGKAR